MASAFNCRLHSGADNAAFIAGDYQYVGARGSSPSYATGTMAMSAVATLDAPGRLRVTCSVNEGTTAFGKARLSALPVAAIDDQSSGTNP